MADVKDQQAAEEYRNNLKIYTGDWKETFDTGFLAGAAHVRAELPSIELIIKIVDLYETLRVVTNTLHNGQWCQIHREVTPQEIREALIKEQQS